MFLKFALNTPLKFKIRLLDYYTQIFVLARRLFGCVSAPLDIKIKANPNKLD